MIKFKNLLLKIFRALGCEYKSIELCDHAWTVAAVVLPELHVASIAAGVGMVELPRYCTKCGELEIKAWYFTSKTAEESAVMSALQKEMPYAKPGDFAV